MEFLFYFEGPVNGVNLFISSTQWRASIKKTHVLAKEKSIHNIIY